MIQTSHLNYQIKNENVEISLVIETERAESDEKLENIKNFFSNSHEQQAKWIIGFVAVAIC